MEFDFNADYSCTYVIPENDKLVDACLLPCPIHVLPPLPSILGLSQQ